MVLTLYSLYQFDTTLFDTMALPEQINRGTCIDNIILTCGQFGVSYQNPDFLKKAIQAWSETRKNSWERIYMALYAEYNPIENYDRTEESTDTGRVNGNANSENYNTSFESGQYQATQKNDTDSSTESEVTRNSRIHGNIGVTTNQQMINQELEMRARDIYNMIAREFKKTFCIAIYY